MFSSLYNICLIAAWWSQMGWNILSLTCSGNGFALIRSQTITWTSAASGPSVTQLNEILFATPIYALKIRHFMEKLNMKYACLSPGTSGKSDYRTTLCTAIIPAIMTGSCADKNTHGMMTSWHGETLSALLTLWEGNLPGNGPIKCRASMFPLLLTWRIFWANTQVADDFRRSNDLVTPVWWSPVTDYSYKVAKFTSISTEANRYNNNGQEQIDGMQ